MVLYVHTVDLHLSVLLRVTTVRTHNRGKVITRAGFVFVLALLAGCATDIKTAARSDNPQTCEDYCMTTYRTCIGNCPNPDENLRCTASCQKGYGGCTSRCPDSTNRPCC